MCRVWGLRGVGQQNRVLCFAQEPASILLLFCQALPGVAIWLRSRLYHLCCCTVFCRAQSVIKDKTAKAVTAEDPLYRKLAPRIAELFLACNYFIKFRGGILLQHLGKAVGSWRGKCDFWDSEALFPSGVIIPSSHSFLRKQSICFCCVFWLDGREVGIILRARPLLPPGSLCVPGP